VGKGEGASPDAKENKDVEARAAELIADVFMNFLLSMVWVFVWNLSRYINVRLIRRGWNSFIVK